MPSTFNGIMITDDHTLGGIMHAKHVGGFIVLVGSNGRRRVIRYIFMHQAQEIYTPL